MRRKEVAELLRIAGGKTSDRNRPSGPDAGVESLPSETGRRESAQREGGSRRGGRNRRRGGAKNEKHAEQQDNSAQDGKQGS